MNPLLWFLIPFIALMGAPVWTYRRSEPVEYWKLALLAALPLFWVFIGVSAGAFRVRWDTPPAVHNPAWVFYPIEFGILAFIAYAIALVVYLRGARWFASLFVLLNLFFMLLMTFFALMLTTGDAP